MVSMVQGDVVHGFRLVRKYPSGDFQGTLYAFEHVGCGAQVFWFSTDAKEAVGMIGVRTPVADDTGVAHVLEHMLCYGDAWQTIILDDASACANAFTQEHLTGYHFTSRDSVKFRKYLSVLLDSIYHPLYLSNPRIFAMEGWRYDFSPEGKLFYNGAVYNERRMGETYLRSMIAKALYPGSQACWDAGGAPSSIVHLQHADVVAFYQKCYYPSNTAICLYGDLDIEDTLHFLDRTYFAQAERRAPLPFDAFHERPKRMLRVRQAYEKLEQGPKKRLFVHTWMLATDELHPNPAEQAFLDAQLFGEASLIPKRWKRAAFSPAGFRCHPYGREAALLLPCMAWKDPSDAQYDREMHRFLAALRGRHFQQANIHAAFASETWRAWKEKQEKMPPLELCQSILRTFAMGRDFAETFHRRTDEELLRAHLADGSLDRFVQRVLVATPPALFLTLVVSHELHVQARAAEVQKLAERQAQMTADELAAIRKKNQELLPPSEAVAGTPLVPTAAEEKTGTASTPELIEETVGGATVVHASVPMNGTCYFDMNFDASHLTSRRYADLFLLEKALTHFPTKGARGASFEQRCKNILRDFTPSAYRFHARKGRDEARPFFHFHFSCAAHEVKAALQLIEEMLFATSFEDEATLHDILNDAYRDSMENLTMEGRSAPEFAIQTLMSSIAPFPAGRQQLLEAAVRQLGKWKSVVHLFHSKLRYNLADTLRSLCCHERAVIFFAASSEAAPDVQRHLTSFLFQLPKKGAGHTRFQVRMKRQREGFYSDQPLQYIAAGARFPYHASQRVLAQVLLNGYLLPHVRQIGGAYEFNVLSYEDGSFALMSGRDPHLAETLDTFAHADAFIRTLDISDERLAGIIDGLLPREWTGTPLGKSQDAFLDWKEGITPAVRKRWTNELRQTTVDQLRAYAPALADLAQSGSLCAVGNEAVLRANANRFDALWER